MAAHNLNSQRDIGAPQWHVELVEPPSPSGVAVRWGGYWVRATRGHVPGSPKDESRGMKRERPSVFDVVMAVLNGILRTWQQQLFKILSIIFIDIFIKSRR